MKNNFLNAMQFRHACKLFDENKKVAKTDLDFILETGRLSPSSFGVEHWRFIVVQSADLKKKLKSACYDQPQVGTASAVVVILGLKEDLKPGSEYIQKMFKRLQMPEEKYEAMLGFYKFMVDQLDITWWSISQCHIAGANMMTSAASIGIDSCPIGGYDMKKVKDVLGVDSNKYTVGLIIPFGYRVNEQRGKTRLPIDELVEYR
ncbi:Oxygen-insensitive NAD(P)H nitroreductase / Dihydropteridine reductase [hydrothermal vent metagenome]|uniref:Oxygen-insensitive NAD(P)H nitroreductase / Dihydropteridine reductase n=1 Tax=hydrothermal vent metagenome TaxID=652676 RepID=A0A3B1C9C7_9ZZZZ